MELQAQPENKAPQVRLELELPGQKEPLDLQALLESKALLEPLVLLEMLELLV